MSISIKDIAQQASVSPSTVSRALNDHPRISEETKSFIRQIANEMGYVPSEVARTLVGQRTATIGVAIPEFADPFYMGILSGIEEVAIENNFDLVVGSFKRDPQRERKLFDAFEEKRLAGLVIAGTLVDDAYLTRSRNALPAVLVNQPDCSFAVDIDQEKGSQLAIEHLIELGHQRIAYIGLEIASESEQRRFEGYRATLQDSGVAFDPSLRADSDGGIEGGVLAAKELFAQPEPPTAVFCYNDRTAIGAIHAFHREGLRVPDDVSVVGFDDLEIASYVNPPLTTIRQPTVELGRRAATMLFAKLNGEPSEPQKLVPHLIVRHSTSQQEKAPKN